MSEQDDIYDELMGEGPESDDPERETEPDGRAALKMRTAVMAKNELLALLCVKTSAQGGIIVRVDPRQRLPAAQTYEDSMSAIKWFNRSLATSKRNGWSVLYDGPPLYG